MAKDKFDKMPEGEEKEKASATASAAKTAEEKGLPPKPGPEEEARIFRGATKLTRNLGPDAGVVETQTPQVLPTPAALGPSVSALSRPAPAVSETAKPHEPAGRFGNAPVAKCKHCGKSIYPHQVTYACPARS